MDGLSYRLVGAISFCIWGIKVIGRLHLTCEAMGVHRYTRSTAYAQREIVKDMIELIDSLGGDKAVWIGHDWGSPVAWNVALHHPERVAAVASLCVPFGFSGRPEDLEYAINRELYPADEYPAGQWDYQLFYYENFDKAQEEMEENPERLAKLLFRKGDPNGQGQIAATALTRKK